MRFKVFHRTWWKHNPTAWGGLEPCPGKKKTIGYADSEAQAREMCRVWNANHEAGRLSDKAEYQQA